jgi:hypothetical protein
MRRFATVRDYCPGRLSPQNGISRRLATCAGSLQVSYLLHGTFPGNTPFVLTQRRARDSHTCNYHGKNRRFQGGRCRIGCSRPRAVPTGPGQNRRRLANPPGTDPPGHARPARSRRPLSRLRYPAMADSPKSGTVNTPRGPNLYPSSGRPQKRQIRRGRKNPARRKNTTVNRTIGRC